MQDMKHYGLRSINSLLIVFGIRKNCLISGRSLLLYQFTRRAIKLTIVIIMGCHCFQLHTKFYPSLKVKSICNEITVADAIYIYIYVCMYVYIVIG
jgi:hypothetical protein